MVVRAILLFLVVMNLGAFTVYGVDKKIAQHNARGVPLRRVSEKALFLWALLGGAAGAWLGMKVWRHKTRHWYFVWGIPALLVIQLGIAVWAIVCL